MPVEFLTEEQKCRYGCYAGEPSTIQLAQYFHLDDTDRSFISRRRGNHNRLGFALQLVTVRFIGTFLPNPINVPPGVVICISNQLGITDITCLKKYMTRRQTWDEHRIEIKEQYGYHDFNDPPWRFRLSRRLYASAWISNERPSLLFDLATSWLIQNKVILPGATTLSRLISQIRQRSTERLWQCLSRLPSAEQRERLNDLLNIPEGMRTSIMEQLRQSPTYASGTVLKNTLIRYETLRDIGVRTVDFSKIPLSRLKTLARYAATIWAPKISRMPEERRISILLAFVRAYEIIALDDALDVLDLLITEFVTEGIRMGKKERLRTLRDLDQAALDLSEICTLFLDGKYNDGQLRQVIFSKFSRERVSEAIETINSLARPKGNNYYQELISKYKSIRRFLPYLLNTISFQSTTTGKAVLEAIMYLKSLEGKRKPILEDAPMDIVSSAWKTLVIDKNGKVSRSAYTLCALERLQDSLRRRDVFVACSERWGDPRINLLQGNEWKEKRLSVCRSLGHSLNADDIIRDLTTQLDNTYRQVIENLPNNEAIRIEMENGKPTLCLSNLDQVEEPSSLVELRNDVDTLLPRVDLTELLLEINMQTEFTREFTHISERLARVDDLHISLCALLLAEACNIGLESLVKENIPALTHHRLHWVQQNYIRAETLLRANARLVDYQTTLPLAREWGGGDVASADGLRFVTPVRTLNSGPNRKYFGSKRGITYYNFISDQYTGFHGIVVPGTLRDSIFILEGLLEQQTSLRPSEVMTDTAGASNIIFGLFWVLGYQFSPRLADIGSTRFWRIDKSADYGSLNDLSRNIINPNRIKQNWDDILRIGGSLKMGTIRASELMRSLLKSDKPSSLSKAIADLGKISKTIYMLNYIDDETYRRRILIQLNRGEGRHGIARIICHGKRGEIRKRYREGQEDQLCALGLVTNTVILWNTIYTQEALKHLRAKRIEVKPEDIVRLSPLQSTHINVLGQYSFTLSGPPVKGKLRPLHTPQTEEYNP